MCIWTHACMWRSEGNLERLALCFHHVRSRDHTEVAGFGSKHLHLEAVSTALPWSLGLHFWISFGQLCWFYFIDLFLLFVLRQDLTQLRLVGSLTGMTPLPPLPRAGMAGVFHPLGLMQCWDLTQSSVHASKFSINRATSPALEVSLFL